MEPLRGLSVASSPTNYKVVWSVALFVAILQAFYAAGFIGKTSCTVEGQRYFCLFDDAMISMRYAANWASGKGLVWNPGQRVEGYTNLGWTAVMALCHLLDLSPSRTCLLVQLLGVPVLWGCVVATVLLARSCRLSTASACWAVVLVGTFYNLVFFTLLGMETGLLTCLVTLALADSVQSFHQMRGRLRPMLWFVPAVLVRLDVVPVMFLVFAFLFLSAKEGRYRVIAGLAIVASVILIHFLWRYHYYGQWLPNTYYLKATGWPFTDRLVSGIKQTCWTGLTLGPPFLLALVALLRAQRWHFLILGAFALAVAYQLYVGGDAWPLNRFVLPISLALLTLAMEGAHRLTTLSMRHQSYARRLLIEGILAVLCIIAANGIHWDHWILLKRPQTASGNLMNIRYVHAVEKLAGPEATVAVAMAGAFPYFSNRTCFDLLGRCDPYIARLPAHPSVRRPGHNKFDMRYSLKTYKPDVILHAVNPEDPLFRDNYQCVYSLTDGHRVPFLARKKSPSVKTDAIGTLKEVRDYQRRAEWHQ